MYKLFDKLFNLFYQNFSVLLPLIGNKMKYSSSNSSPFTLRLVYSKSVEEMLIPHSSALSTLFLTLILSILGIISSAQTPIPASIPKLKMWLTADSVEIISGKIATWYDLSGNNFNPTQSNATNRPIKVNSSQLGKPVIRFDGTNWLKFQFPSIIPQPITIFIVYNITSYVGQPQIVFSNYMTSDFYLDCFNSNLYVSAGTQLQYPKVAPFDPILNTLYFNGSSSSNYENGNIKITGNTGSNSMNGITIGAYQDNTYPLIGDIAEIILYDTVLTNSNRVAVENYLMNKYAPPVDLGYDININYGFCDTMLHAGTRFTKYLWSTGDTLEHIKANKSGLYWVKTTDIFGVQSTDTIEVIYLSKPNPISDTIVCQFDTTKVSINIGSPYTYNWSNGQSSSTFTTSIPEIFQLQIIDSLGCIYRDTFTVVLDSLPTKLSLGEDTAICFSNPIGYQLINYIPIDGLSSNFRYLWSTGDTISTTPVNSTDDYTLRLTNQRGCIARDTVHITLKGFPPVVTLSVSADSACTGDTIYFADLTTGVNTSRLWELGNGASSNDSTFYYMYDTAGIYTISLTVTGSNGCPKTIFRTLTIHKSPQVSFTTAPPCIGLATNFTNSSTAAIGDTIINQFWNFDDVASGVNNTSTLQNPEHQFSNTGTFTPQLSITTSKGCSSSVKQTLNVASSATLPNSFTLASPQNNQVLSDSTITFKWNYTDNAYFYTLQIASDEAFNSIIFQKNNITNQYFSNKFTTFGTYYWRVLAVNICGNSTYSPIYKLDLFAPSMYPGLQLWLNADSVIKDASNNVVEWSDLSNNSYNISQSTTSNQPKQIQNQLNGHALIQFDGANDYLDGGDILDLELNNHELFIFCKNNSAQATFLSKNNSSVSLSGGYSFNINANTLQYIYNDNGMKLISTAFPLSQYQIIKATNDRLNNNNKLFLNQILKGSIGINSSINMNSTCNFLIGAFGNAVGSTPPIGGFYLNGEIGDIIIYNTPLTEAQQQTVETYIQNKYAPPVSLGYDMKFGYKLCDTATIIGANKPWFTNWLWSTGDTTATISVNQNGSYWVKATNIFGMTSSDTIEVIYPGHQKFLDNSFCFGDTLTYQYIRNYPYNITWSNGDTGKVFKTHIAGTYSVIISDSLGCSYRDTFNLYVDSLALRMSLGNDLSLCSGNLLNYTLDNYTLTNPQYVWSTGDTTASIVLTTSGDYWLKITNNQGCIAQDTVSVYIHGLVPLVSFTSPGKCLGESTPFNDLSTSQDQSIINQWQWNFGDGNNSTSQNPTHNYALPGIYPITLTVTTDSNCSNTTTIPTVVYTLPEVNFTPQVGCSNTLIQFTDQTQYTDNYTIDQWQWHFGDTQSGSYNQSILQHPNHSFDTSGTYTVKLRATSIVGCTDSITKTITIRSAPVANFVASNTCEGKATWFSDSTTTSIWNPIMSRTWIFEDETSSTEVATSRKYLDYGSYPVTYIVTSLNGCTDTITKNINVYAVPVANFTPNSFCSNEPVILESGSSVESDIITYERWKIGNNRVMFGSPVQLYLDSAANYPVQLISTSQHNCSDTVIKNITVKPIPQSQFTYKYDELSVGYNIQFINNTTGASSYDWHSSNGLFSTDQNPIFDFAHEGTFPILLISRNNQSCSDSASANILIVSPVMDISVSNFTITTLGNYQQAQVNLINMSNRNITDLWITLQINDQQIRERWSGMIRPGEIIPYQFNTQIYTPSNENLEYGCIKISSPIFTQETNLDNNQICITLDEEFKILKLYPNPANEYITLWLSSPYESQATIRILTTKGSEAQIWSNQSLQKGITKLKLPLAELNNGLYIMEVEFNNRTERMKFNVIR